MGHGAGRGFWAQEDQNKAPSSKKMKNKVYKGGVKRTGERGAYICWFMSSLASCFPKVFYIELPRPMAHGPTISPPFFGFFGC